MVTHSFKSSKVGASPVESQAGRVVVRSGRGAGRLKLLRPLALRDGIGEMLGRGFRRDDGKCRLARAAPPFPGDGARTRTAARR